MGIGGVAVKDAWSGGSEGGGSLRDLSKNILKQGVGKGKNCSYGEGGFEGVTTPAPSRKIFIIHKVSSNMNWLSQKF